MNDEYVPLRLSLDPFFCSHLRADDREDRHLTQSIDSEWRGPSQGSAGLEPLVLLEREGYPR
jgi:hypothetical protein